MSETKRTPGPWKIQEAFNRIETEQEIICTVDGWELRNGKANARLISAAPNLMETVVAYRLHHKLMLNVADDTDCPCKIYQMAEAAIAKARWMQEIIQ